MAEPFFTVIICTRNRANSLRTVLTSICEADQPETPWELVVVDNGSTDDTPEVIGEFAGKLPIRREWQPIAGLSNARNAGVATATGRFVLWTDDDVTVAKSWLVSFEKAFRENPGIEVFGGGVLPSYQAPAVEWFVKAEADLHWLLAYRNHSGEIDLNRTGAPFGACYALKTSAQRDHLYDPNLGVAPGRRTGGEETTVIESILKGGGRGVWVDGGVVNHIISHDRQTLKYIHEFYTAGGSQYPIKARAIRIRWSGVPIQIYLACASAYISYLWKRATGSNWVERYIRYSRSVGSIKFWKNNTGI